MNELVETLKRSREHAIENGIYAKLQIEFSYNDTQCERGMLTYPTIEALFYNTAVIDNDGGFNRYYDTIEAKNQFEVFDYILDTVDEPLTEVYVKEIHRILRKNTHDEVLKFAIGEYKTMNNAIGYTSTTDKNDVTNEMNELFNHPSVAGRSVEEIAYFHKEFERIHPFQNANGRVGRVIVLKQCLSLGILPAIIERSNIREYYNGLKEDSDVSILIHYFKERIVYYSKMLETYLNEKIEFSQSTILSLVDREKELKNWYVEFAYVDSKKSLVSFKKKVFNINDVNKLLEFGRIRIEVILLQLGIKFVESSSCTYLINFLSNIHFRILNCIRVIDDLEAIKRAYHINSELKVSFERYEDILIRFHHLEMVFADIDHYIWSIYDVSLCDNESCLRKESCNRYVMYMRQNVKMYPQAFMCLKGDGSECNMYREIIVY